MKRKILLLFLLSFLASALSFSLASCLSSDNEPIVQSVTDAYTITYTSGKDGTCYVSDITINPEYTEEIILEIPETAPNGDKVIAIRCSPLAFDPPVPTIIPEDDFEKFFGKPMKDKMEEEGKGWYYNQRFLAFFTLWDPAYFEGNDRNLAELYKYLPITKEIGAVYQINGEIRIDELAQIYQYILQYSEYTSKEHIELYDRLYNLVENSAQENKTAMLSCLPTLTDSNKNSLLVSAVSVPADVEVDASFYQSFCGAKEITISSNTQNLTSNFWGCFPFLEKLEVYMDILPSVPTSKEHPNLVFNEKNGVKYLGNSVEPYIIAIGPTDSTIQNVTLENTTKSISDSAFWNSSALTSIDIPAGVISIGNHAFSDCSSLESITIPESVTSIGENTFYGCSSLTSINIPKGVTAIGNRAFYGCSSLTSINISDSVTSIGTSAFTGCSSLTNINIPNSVTSIGEQVFWGCSSLENILVAEGNTVYHSNGNCLIETATKILLAGCKSSVIPADGSVTAIGDRAFYDCSSLTIINIPESVTSIGMSAFQGCSSLTSINVPEGITSIGKAAFYGCSSLTRVTISENSNLASIDKWAFGDCSALASIQIPNKVTSIGESAFYGCSSLENILVAEGNTVYHSNGNCLVEIATKTLLVGCNNSVIPTDGSVTSIGDSAFSGCSSLTIVNIPEGVTSIGDTAFGDCSYLTSINIPNSVTSIGRKAFAGCSSLTELTYGGSIEKAKTLFKRVYLNDGITIHCTDGDYVIGG